MLWHSGQFVEKTKEQKQELFLFLQQASKQCIGTMDTRLCAAHALYLTKRSLCGGAVDRKLTGLHLTFVRILWELVNVHLLSVGKTEA